MTIKHLLKLILLDLVMDLTKLELISFIEQINAVFMICQIMILYSNL